MDKATRGVVFLWALGATLGADITLAQSYPAKPVRIVVTVAPGGGNDFVARLVGQKLGERLGQQFIVENRPGAGGAIGTAQAAKAAPDGYTLLFGFSGPLTMSPHVEKTGYDPLRDFVGVSLLASSYLVLAVHPSLPARSVKQLIALARARPGELNYASGNIWTLAHLAPELLKSVTAIDVFAIHYKGTGPAAIALLTGEAHMMYAPIPTLMPHVKAKRLVALAAASPTRLAAVPEVPTLAESGVRGAEAPSWYALLAPAATPKDVVGKLHGEVVKVAADRDFQRQLENLALEPQTSTPDQFAAFLQAEYDKWGKIIKRLKLE